MFEWGLVGFFGLFGLAGFILWIWALVDALRVPDDSQFKSGSKVIWVLVILLANLAGAVIYLVIGRPDGGASAAIAQWSGRTSGSTAPPPPGTGPAGGPDGTGPTLPPPPPFAP